MMKLLAKQKWYVLAILLLIIAEPSINSVLNFWLQGLFNAASPGAEKIPILRLLTAGFLLWMLKRLVSFTSGVVKNRFICNAKQEVKHRLFVGLMQYDVSTVGAIASSGEYISLFTNDITLLETRFYNQIVGLISGIFSIVILGTSFIALNAKLAAAILAFGVITTFVPLFFSKKLNEKSLLYSSGISKFTQRMKEYMVAYPTIKNYSIEKKISERFDRINSETENAKFEADYALTLANNVGQLLSWFMQFIGVGLGLMMVIKGEILIGTVIAAQSFAGDLASPLQSIIINVNSIRSVKEIVNKIRRLSQSPGVAAPPDANGTVPRESVPAEKACEITFDHFTLRKEGRAIVNDFSFTFAPGKKYLVVGLNGAGKSTLFKSLKKWYEGSEGGILLNGQNVFALSDEEISRKVSYLNENVSMFTGTVEENISLYRDCSEEAFRRAVLRARVGLVLNREVSDEGANVSSGEKRRIEIARSLIADASVLVFDEVVSTLDIETAYEIEKMAMGFEDKTVIFISHNFSGKLIRSYDEILVMEDGKLLSHGRHDDLIASCEYFRRICEIKFGTVLCKSEKNF